MTPKTFRENWINPRLPLYPFSRTFIDSFNFRPATVDFLSMAGLPAYTEADINFVSEKADESFYRMMRLTEMYSFMNFSSQEIKELNRYVVIGSCNDGDVVAIDTKDNDKIVRLDHEDSFMPDYFNSSIEAMADFIIFYRDFELEVLITKIPVNSSIPVDLIKKNKSVQELHEYLGPDHNLSVFDFTDQQLENLRLKMAAVDSVALTEAGFWQTTIEGLPWIREREFPGHGSK